MDLFSKKKIPLSLVLDIRDVSVSVAVLEFAHNEKPNMVWCENIDIANLKKADHNTHIHLAVKAIDKAVLSARNALVKMGVKNKIGKHFFFIGSPWSISRSKTIKIIKDRRFEIDNKLLGRIITGEELNTQNHIYRRFQNRSWTLLEERVIQTKIDGEVVEDIFGKKTSELEVDLFVSFVPNEIKEKIMSFVDDKPGEKNIYVHSCILSSYSFMRDLFKDKNDFIYMDMGDIVTDVYVVRNDIIHGVISIPEGEKEIIQYAALKTGLPEHLISSELNAYKDGHTDFGNQKVKDAMNEKVRDCLSKISESLFVVCKEIKMPKNIFIVANSGLAHFFVEESLRQRNIDLSKIFGKKMDMTVINEIIMNDLVSNGRIFPHEPYIKMDVVFINYIKDFYKQKK